MTPLRVGIVGTGHMARTHARAYGRIADVELTGVVSRDPARGGAFSAEWGGTWYRSTSELVASDVDAVDVCTPTPHHVTACMTTLSAGLPTICEKPIARTIEEANALLLMSEANRAHLYVAHVLRFWPGFVAVRDRIADGTIGHPVAAMARRLSALPPWGAWFSDPEVSGGALLDLQIHDLDLMAWYFGDPNQIITQGVRGPNGGFEHVHTLLSIGAIRCSIQSSFLMPAMHKVTSEVIVLGDEAAVTYRTSRAAKDSEVGGLVIDGESSTTIVPVPVGDPYEAQLRHFVFCIRRGEPSTIAPTRDAVRAMALCHASRQSADQDGARTLLT